MLNAIRMEWFRMFRTKSLYVIWISLVAFVFLSTCLLKEESAELQSVPNAQEQEQVNGQNKPDQEVALGISVESPEDDNGSYTVLNIVSSNLQARVLALFLVIFAVLYVRADSSSGYIKNIAGQIPHRSNLVIAKAVMLFVYTVMSVLLFVAAQAVSCAAVFRYVAWGNVKEMIPFLLCQTLLHFALLVIGMFLVYLMRSSVWSMILMILICANFISLLYVLINMAIYKLGIANFDILNYTVTGKIARIPLEGGPLTGGFVIGAAFIVILSVFTCVIANRRDVV